jgi:hypothetical protein
MTNTCPITPYTKKATPYTKKATPYGNKHFCPVGFIILRNNGYILLRNSKRIQI